MLDGDWHFSFVRVIAYYNTIVPMSFCSKPQSWIRASECLVLHTQVACFCNRIGVILAMGFTQSRRERFKMVIPRGSVQQEV